MSRTVDCDLLYSIHNMLINHGVVCKAFGLGKTSEVGSSEGWKGKDGNEDEGVNSESKIQNAS